MKIYLVGGAVRDRLLGMRTSVTERDWVVVGATGQAMLDQGYRRLDNDFPVFLHPETGDEYALARSEHKTGDGYKGFTTLTTPDITLEQDLPRRDLTINAMAEDADGQLIDPCHGERDLQARILHHITPAFVEDPVRVLRVARFAAYLGDYGFKVAADTLALMQQMSAAEDFSHLKSERIWQEFKRSLTTVAPWRFLQVLHQCGALQHLIPLLDQHYPSAVKTLKRATVTSDDPVLRFVALFYWPVTKSGIDVKVMCRALRIEKRFSDLLQLAVINAPSLQNLQMSDTEGVLNLFEQSKAIRNPQAFNRLTQLGVILWPERSDLVARLTELLPLVTALSANELQRSGLQGRALGNVLRQARLHVIEAFCASQEGQIDYAAKK